MVALAEVAQHRVGFKSGGGSTQKAGKPTATGTRALIQRQFGNGGIIGTENTDFLVM